VTVPGDSTEVVDLILPATPLAPGEARRALGELADHVSAVVLEDARLLASELVTNSVRHGAAGPASRVRFRAITVAGRIVIEVTDWGPGFEARRAQRPAPDGRSGYGLFLVDRLARRWGIDRDGAMRVWCELAPAPRTVAN